jgi:fructoselysine 6-kinase
MQNANRADHLVAIGDNCIDVYVQTGERLVGGNAVNVAVQWALAGRASAYVGAVGPDADGARVIAALSAAGVGVTGVRTLSGATGVTEIEIRADGDRVLLSEDFGVSADLRLSDADVDDLVPALWAHCATLDGFRAVARRFAVHDVPVSVDFSTRFQLEDLSPLEVAFYSCAADETAAARDVVARAVEGGARIAIATCGAAGSVAEWSTGTPGTAFVPAVEVDVVDTLGAGDTYASEFVTARLAGADVPEAMAAASLAAAVTCGHRGAWPQAGTLVEEHPA